MSGYVQRGECPGIVTLISRQDSVHVSEVGTMAFKSNEPMRRDTIFRISSMTKPITAAATMILVEEGKLRLDDAVDGILPELANRKVLRSLDSAPDDIVPASRPITVRDLLTFLWGFGMLMAWPGTYPIQELINERGLGPSAPNPGRAPAPDEWMRRLGELPLLYQPGEAWLYNAGSDVLGVLIARASGHPFEAFLRERIFDPLGMKDTGFSVPAAGIDRLATSYATDFQTGKIGVYDEAAGGQWSRPPAFPSGAGGLVSTIDDYLAFGQMMLAGGKHKGARILSRPSVERMTADHLTPQQAAASAMVLGTSGWGFGVAVVTKRDSPLNIGSFGWSGGMGTSWYSDPREGMVTILMTQAAWPTSQPPNVLVDFWTLAYAAIED